MTVETVLLILESVLLIATIILLLFSIKEGRGRRNMLMEVGKVSRMLTRQQYFLNVTDAMMDAEAEIAGIITGRMPAEDDRKRIQDITNNIERISKNGVTVRYLIPKFHDRLHVGYHYTRAGAQVRYSVCAVANNIRYIVVDDKIAVIGIPEDIGEKAATRKGYRIPSEGLAVILKDHFSRCWEESMPYEEYIKEVIAQTGATSKVLEKELQIDEDELKKYGA